MKDKEFGNRLKHLRNRLKLTQIDASNKIGISYKGIQLHEGGGWPNRNNLQKYIDFYKCNKAWLTTGEGEPFPKMGDGTEPALYNKVKESISTFEAMTKNEINKSDLLKKTIDILESDSIYRAALASNINAFHYSIQTENKLSNMDARMSSLESQMADLIDENKKLKALLEEKPETKKEDEAEAGSEEAGLNRAAGGNG